MSARAEARIVVTGDAGAAFLRAELDGVRYAPLSAAAPPPDADVLVFVLDAAGALDAGRAQPVAHTAREHGALVAAIVTGIGGLPAGSPLLADVRELADMVMLVEDLDQARGIVAALR